MASVLGRRLLRLLATLFAVSILTFVMINFLPGDPVDTLLGARTDRTPELEARMRADLNLDDPMPVRYVRWLGDAVTGDLGRSYIGDQEVSDIIKDRLPVTGQLAVMAIILAVLLAIPLGVIGAYRQGRWQDSAASGTAQFALSVPNFVIGIFLQYLFAVQLGLLDNTGWSRLSNGVWDNLTHAILPASALAMTQMAIFSRLIRADMIATLQENYILAARAKGMSDRFVLLRHALRPSSLSLATIIGINFGALLGGTVIIEELFALPGLGRRLFEAINKRDYLVVQGITVFIAATYVVINTIVDLLYAVIDPRIRRR